MAKLTTKEFIEKAKAVHGDRYDYSKVEYVGAKIKVCIVCKEHGEFQQSPQKHLAGQGCIKCHRKYIAKRYSLGKEKFIEKADVIHNGFYDYREVEYVNSHTKVKIICPIHGAFEQEPASHLKGHGCSICANIENGKRKRKWTYETCRNEARKYKTKVEFHQGCSGAFKYAYDNDIIKDFIWFEELKKPNGYWNRERCEEEARKYKTKGEFLKGCSAAHHAAVENGWLNDYDWLIDKRINIIKDKIDCVYVYIFEDTKTAYVGRTLIRRQKKRDKEHIFNLEADNVARYAKKHHVPVPPMTILETNLTLEEGLDREDYWRRWYEQQGYTMLNRLATGIGRGSLGGISHGKWNCKSCYEEARKYNSASEFGKANGSAYDSARRNGWIKDYTWFDVLWEAKWDKLACFNEAKKYKTRNEFHKGCGGAYNKAYRMGWLDDYDWMPSRKQKPNGYWDNYDHCYEEAKKYHSRSEFGRHAVRAYELALANGWIDDYTWFKPLTGYWTYEACKAEAAKYEKRSHFKAESKGAYTKSRLNGWLDDFFPPKE